MGMANLGEQVTSKATRNRNAASKKLISRKSSKIKGFRFHGGIAQLGARATSTSHSQIAAETHCFSHYFSKKFQ